MDKLKNIKIDKKKYINIALIFICIISVILIGTYALKLWSSTENTELTFRIGEYTTESLICKSSEDITISNIGPVFNYTKDGEIIPFKVLASSDNTSALNVNFNISTITDNLKVSSFKYILMSSKDNNTFEELIKGDFSNTSNNTQIPLISNNVLKETTYYKLIIYIDGNIENPTSIQNGSITGSVEICAEKPVEPNSPDLVQGLIPVVYNESTSNWVKADSTNANNSWYDYDNKLWANAVLVTEKNRSTYQNATPGTTIAESDILAFYVWIPRYKYKVWNKDKVIGTASYDAYNTGIDIVFESEKASTGTINCTYSYAEPSSDAGSPNETCTGSNGDYYTHPAFTFGSDNIRGFWMGKFELTGSSSQLTILPNVSSLRSQTVSSFSTMIQNMQASSNIYGLNTSRTNTDSHMITNMEWGAVAYLTNSKYGRCTSGSCTEVTINNCSSYITGIGADSVSDSKSSTTCTTTANKYNGTKGVLASTTGNITGVYDMSGGAFEYAMGNVSNASGSYTFYSSISGFASNWYTASTAKYLTTYAYGGSNTNQTAYNRSRLGDATGEVVLSTGGSGGWHLDYAYFPSNSSWFLRSGPNLGRTGAGVFYFDNDGGASLDTYSSRTVLVSVSA